MFQAILLFSQPWRPLEHQAKVSFHWILQGIAVTLASFGFTAIYMNKVNLGKDHFHSTHAKWGLWTFIFTHSVVLGGIWAKYSFQLRSFLKPITSKLIHSFFGTITFLMAMITICLAFYSKWWDRNVDSESLRLLFVLILFASNLFVLIPPLINNVKKFKNILKM